MFEAYRVGVRLSLINNVTQGLSVISGNFRKTSDEAKALQKQLKEIKLLGAVGFGVGAVGFMGLHIIGKVVKPAEEYVHQLRLANQQGFTHIEMLHTQKKAWETLRDVPTSTVSKNIEAIRDLSTVLTSRENAIAFMPQAQRIQAILETYLHGQPGSKKTLVGELGKSLEMKGWVHDIPEMLRSSEAITRAIVAMGGKISTADYLSAVKYGRKSGLGWDINFMQNYLPTIIQEMKGRGGSGVSAGAGPALQAMSRVVVSGISSQESFALFDKLGLLDKSKIVRSSQGKIKSVGPGGFIGSDIFKDNPYYWARDILSPALTKAGITKPKEVSDMISHLFKTGTADFMATQMVMQQWKFERDALLVQKALPNGVFGGYSDLVKNDPVMAHQAFEAQWESLKVALGAGIIPTLIAGLTKLNEVLPKVSNFVHDNEGAFKLLGLALGGLSVGLVAGGGALAISAATKAMSLAFTTLSGGAAIGGLQLALGKAGLLGNLVMLIPLAWELSKAYTTVAEKTYDYLHPVGSDDANHYGVKRNPLYDDSSDYTRRLSKMRGVDKYIPITKEEFEARPDFINQGRNKSKSTPLEAHIYLGDGEKLARVLTTAQSNEAQRASNNGGSGFNMRHDPIPAGGLY